MTDENVIAITGEADAARKALDGLEEYAEEWAEQIGLESIAQRITGDSKKVEAMLIQCFIEGCYRGRVSHKSDENSQE